MLTVKTIVKSSPIEGVGLFADQFINKDEPIFMMDNSVVQFPAEELNFLPVNTKIYKFLTKYGWKEGKTLFLSMDNDRFTNHSTSPNTYMDKSIVRALDDIKKGEEITSDYRHFNELPIKF